MSNSIQMKQAISQHIQKFSSQPLRQAALSLFSTLGYASDRTVETPSVAEFRAQFDSESKLEHPAALIASWQSAELLFQLTDEELSRSTALFKDEAVKTSLLQSYVFIAIELADGDHARGKLAGIARQINRIFPMPVMVLFKIGGRLSIAVINRRLNKRDDNKDVLGKVTLIQNIAIDEPHPGHLDILASFSLAELTEGRRVIQNFDQLHAAWEEVFNVELLNKRFYRELANWYFWALPQVDFPADIEKDDEKRRATGLIRLLTRLIFCWFLKEKGLVPDKLFVEADLKKILKDLSPNASTYNEAILQNLFFATLNQRMGKDKNGQPFRAFATDEGFQKNRSTYGVDTLYRYEDHFRDPATALEHFADVPFLNGGLFECLDRIEDGTGKKLYLDGFSRNKKKRPAIPNHLFFGSEHEEDLSGAYGDTKRKREKVRGLLHILNAYKFTIVENTPVDQEIALDPELLGKVFENLLASYNEETKTTARKQTGSFYTPRPIVEYMVDESLKAHLIGALAKAGMSEQDAKAGLDILFAYTERAHPFNEKEVATLLDAIHTCKILDPACGSGAFPMGMLHKLVYIIHKLDPDNARWKQLQIDAAEKIPDVSARDAAIAAIERDFADNEDDYGRKLYLIENCLYGVDIQPIAIQISKLRFFISLVCNQRTNRNKRENHGIRPLPNLETKFVAANALIGLPEMDQLALLPLRVHQIEAEIERLYHGHFGVQRRDQKLALQKKIKTLREELGRELAQSLGSSKKAKHIAEWNPFDPQATADFFDPHWMFGRSLAAGCDIVIGNPPYLKERDSKHIFDVVTDTPWGRKYHQGKMDYWYFFLHRSFEITKPKGIISFITSRYWINSAGSKKLVKHIRDAASLFHVVDIGALPVFELVAGHHMLHFYRVGQQQTTCQVKTLENSLDEIASLTTTSSLTISEQSPTLLFNATDEVKLYESKVQILPTLTVADCFEVSQGVVQNPDKVSAVMSKRFGLRRGEGVFVLDETEFGRLRLNSKEATFVKPFYDEASIAPFRLDRREAKRLLYITKKNCPSLQGMPNIERHLSSYKEIMDARRETVNGSIEWFQLHWPRDPRFFESEKVVIPSMFRTPAAAYVPEPAYFGLGSNVVIGGKGHFGLAALSALLNSSVGCWWFVTNSKKRGIGVDVGVDRLRQFPLPTYGAGLVVVESLVKLIIVGSSINLSSDVKAAVRFIGDVIDACVMECYFRDHMAERDLFFLDDLAPHLAAYKPDAPEAQQREFITQLYRTLNEPTSKIRNRLLRISADSPDLLAIIKEEGKV
ncbi:Eco57I restriction-modification methylase domain-containing protein [Stutzerimonas stutzeri]|uniref:Eco57I restriction-modification methylase domain-containing protein n=1 Tax=Stutzerimonas stutzeri TaxID=316 RepID=UPI0034D473EA